MHVKEKEIIQACVKYGIETDINKRWEEGIAHHPESISLMEAIEEIDYHLFNDYFGWKTGGDGDNGETMMYEMDIWFELQDAISEKNF